MEAYLARFALGEEAYFIIQHEGVDVGTARLYGYREDAESFTWGSWIIKPGINPAAGLLSPLLIYDLAFDCLGFVSAYIDVQKNNVSVWRFHEAMGAKLISENEIDRRYTYSAEAYPAARSKLTRIAGINP